MFSNIVTAGNVGAVVEPFAAEAASTPEGARWLNAYIDPAHGNCDTYPDEDNVYSTPLKSHFTFTIDSSFFTNLANTSSLPSTRSFTVYLTNYPDYPIAVYGTFYTSDYTSGQNRLIFIKDPNLYSVFNSSNSGILESRMMYKGCTLRYTGNDFNNQGVVTTAQFAMPTNYRDVASEFESGITTVWKTNDAKVPVTSTDIAASNKEFYVNRQDTGVYTSNQIMGARSNYIGNNFGRYFFGGVYGDDNTVPFGRAIRPNNYRFSNAATYDTFYEGSVFAYNATWSVMRFDNLDVNQSILIEHFGGYQCHVAANSNLVNFQSFKSYLDPNALAVASQLTASLPMIWPASYNDFRMVWRKISRYLGSTSGQNLVNTIAGISGRYGGLIKAIGGLF